MGYGRTRIKGGKIQITNVKTFKDPDYTTSTPSGYYGQEETISDTSHPGFERFSRGGGIVIDDCFISRWSRSFVPGSFIRVGWSSGLVKQEGDLVADATYWDPKKMSRPNLVIPNSLNGNVLLIRCYAKINEAPIMGGEILATLNQTIGMVRKPFHSASQLLSKMRKYRLSRMGKTARSAAQATADSWLEYRYGWRPIILDTQKVIKDSLAIRARTDRRRSVERAGDAAEARYASQWPATSLNYQTSGSYTKEDKIRCNAGVVYEVVNRTPSDMGSGYFGNSCRDILPTMWELVPYSFVIDWFSNVGEVLQAISPNPAVKYLGHWVTCVYESTSTGSGFRGDSGDAWTGSCGSEIVNNFTFVRTANQEIAFIPEYTGLSLSTLRQADAASLLLKPILSSIRDFRH